MLTKEQIEEIIKDPNRMLPQLEQLLNTRDGTGQQLRILPELMNNPEFAGMIEYIIRDYYNDLRDSTSRLAMIAQIEEDRKFLGKHGPASAKQHIASFNQNYDEDIVSQILQRSSSWHDRELNEYEQKKHEVKILKEAFNL